MRNAFEATRLGWLFLAGSLGLAATPAWIYNHSGRPWVVESESSVSQPGTFPSGLKPLMITLGNPGVDPSGSYREKAYEACGSFRVVLHPGCYAAFERPPFASVSGCRFLVRGLDETVQCRLAMDVHPPDPRDPQRLRRARWSIFDHGAGPGLPVPYALFPMGNCILVQASSGVIEIRASEVLTAKPDPQPSGEHAPLLAKQEGRPETGFCGWLVNLCCGWCRY